MRFMRLCFRLIDGKAEYVRDGEREIIHTAIGLIYAWKMENKGFGWCWPVFHGGLTSTDVDAIDHQQGGGGAAAT